MSQTITSNGTQPASTSVNIITISQQIEIIGGEIDSSMLINFMMGAYTMVYMGTVYLYYTKPRLNSQRPVVISLITILYVLCLLMFATDWYFLKWSMVDNGATRETIFSASIGGGPTWLLAFSIISQYLTYVTSDTLLLWRCFHLWNRSWLVIAFPVFLTFSELAFIVLLTYLSMAQPDNQVFNPIASTLLFVSAGSTVITTGLIGLKVYRDSSHTGSKSRRRFRQIFHVLLESAALYTIVILFSAIINALGSLDVITPIDVVELYLLGIAPISAGVAPTILVARIILARSASESDIMSMTHISGLHFQGQEGSGTASRRPNLSQISGLQNGNVCTGVDLEIGFCQPHDEQEKKEGGPLSVT